jgi:hypothetical protein
MHNCGKSVYIENSAYISIQHKRNLGNTNLERHTKFGLKEVSTREFFLEAWKAAIDMPEP